MLIHMLYLSPTFRPVHSTVSPFGATGQFCHKCNKLLENNTEQYATKVSHICCTSHQVPSFRLARSVIGHFRVTGEFGRHCIR